ncbi:MAG: hypothetical protein ABI637_01185 [Gemmatimonadota bacterium]
MADNKDSSFEEDRLPGSDWKAAWETEDNYWTENFSSRPYAIGPDFYERYRPAYRYGFESAQHHSGRTWDDAEPHLREGWDRYENQGETRSTWEEIKDAVRDAWDRVTGHSASSTEPLDDHATMRTQRDEPRA